MANLRGGQKIWDGDTVASGDVSKFAIPGPGPYVAIYFKNEDATVTGVTFLIEVAVSDSISAGRNALDPDDPDGGLDWFQYDRFGVNPIENQISPGEGLAVDLSPFAPQFIRLRRSDTGDPAVLSAWISSFGE